MVTLRFDSNSEYENGLGGLLVHLIVDGHGGDPVKLQDLDLISRFLDEYPAAIGMTKIVAPLVYTYRGKTPEDWGVSGFVLIAESHISIHTFPDRGYVNIDIFSCKDFEPSPCVDDVKATFSLPDVRVWTLDRGVEFADDPTARPDVASERSRLLSTPGPGDG